MYRAKGQGGNRVVVWTKEPAAATAAGLGDAKSN
jgi:hypothetical protein